MGGVKEVLEVKMAKLKKNGSKTSEDEEDPLYTQAVNVFTEAVVENLEEEHKMTIEPFEAYAQKIRSKVHSNLNEFRTRFNRGYHVLIDEIAKEQKKPSDEDPGKRIIKP